MENKTISKEAADLEKKTLTLKGNSDFFKKVIKNISFFDSEAKIIFKDQNITCKIVDPAHVALLNVNIPVYNIDAYTKTTGDISLGLDVEKILYMFKSSNKKDFFQIDFSEDINQDQVKIKIGLFNHNINLINTDIIRSSKTPVLDLPSCFKIDTKIFYDFLIQAKKISDHISIKTYGDHIEFNAYNDVEKLKIDLYKNDYDFLQSPGIYKSFYSIDYLLPIVKNYKLLFDKITVYTGKNVPLKIESPDYPCKLEVLIAPRIEEY